MNAIDMLKEDHKKVKGLFRQYEQAGDDTSKKQQIANQVFQELQVHTQLEEEIFYPTVREKTKDDAARELVAEGFEEHHVVDQLMEELKQTSPEAEEFDAKFKVLTENVEHHIQEEEEEMLPKAEEALGNEMDRVTQEMQQLKQRLMRTAA